MLQHTHGFMRKIPACCPQQCFAQLTQVVVWMLVVQKELWGISPKTKGKLFKVPTNYKRHQKMLLPTEFTQLEFFRFLKELTEVPKYHITPPKAPNSGGGPGDPYVLHPSGPSVRTSQWILVRSHEVKPWAWGRHHQPSVGVTLKV